ncbi:hypothetical protein [Aerococcus urinae]
MKNILIHGLGQDNSTEADLAGTIYVEQKELPEITIGTKVTIH